MKPESLKQLAEYMGYKVHHLACEERGGLWVGEYESPHEYNPLENAEQCLELMEKSLEDGDLWFFEKFKDGTIKIVDYFDEDKIRGEGKTINEAVTNAAIAAIKE